MSATRYIYAKHPGARIRVGNYGECTDTVPVVVPDSVADELDGAPDLVQTLEQRAPKPEPQLDPNAASSLEPGTGPAHGELPPFDATTERTFEPTAAAEAPQKPPKKGRS